MFLVFAGFSEDVSWTTLRNDLSPQMSVSAANKGMKTALQISYNVTDEQVQNGN